MTTALLLGLLLAVACLAYVLYPLIAPGRRAAGRSDSRAAAADRHVLRGVSDEEIEAAISSYRATHFAAGACVACGPRPESDAVYCSSCGRPLANPPGAR